MKNWAETYKGKREEFTNLQKELSQIYPKEFPPFGTFPTEREEAIGLTVRMTGAGNIVATDLETGLTVKDTTWQGAVMGLRGNLGAAIMVWDRGIFGDNLPLDPRK